MTRFNIASIVLIAAALSIAPLAARAQAYPTKPIRLVIPYAPGGAAGAVARILADKMRASIGQPVVVDHRPGGGTLIGK